MKRLEWKVGLFVLLGLVLAAAMVMRFSKGTGLSTTYTLDHAGNRETVTTTGAAQ